jgi:hypothetical protein
MWRNTIMTQTIGYKLNICLKLSDHVTRLHYPLLTNSTDLLLGKLRVAELLTNPSPYTEHEGQTYSEYLIH